MSVWEQLPTDYAHCRKLLRHRYLQFFWWLGERGGIVVEHQTSNRDVQSSSPDGIVLCP